MGNTVSCTLPNLTEFLRASESSQNIEADDYKIVHEINDPRFGSVQLMKSRSRNHQLCIKERELNYDESELDEIKFRAQLSHPYLIEIYGFKRATAENHIQIYFETFESDLERDIQKAITDKTSLPEEKLNNMLHCTLSVLSYLQENHVKHENITPLNILRIGSTYKLHENSIIMTSVSLFEQAVKGHNLRYLAPELLASVANHDENPKYDSFKADVYSLGICLLDAGVLDFGETTIVDRKKLEIIQENLVGRITRFKVLYSLQLSSIVEEMVALDPRRRPDASSLYKQLPSKIVDERKRIFTPMKDPPKQMEYVSVVQGKTSARTKLGNAHVPEENKASREKNSLETVSNSEASTKQTKMTTVKHEKTMREEGFQSKEQVYPRHKKITNAQNLERKITENQINSSKNRTIFSENIPSKTNPQENMNNNGPHGLKLSEAILHDPILSRIVKNMYEQQKIGSHKSNPASEKKNASAQAVKKPETPNRNFPFLSSTIEDVLEKKGPLRSSPAPSQTSRFTPSKHVSPPRFSDNKRTAPRDTLLNQVEDTTQRTSYVQSILKRSRNQSSNSLGLGNSSDRYAKPRDLSPYEQPYNYFKDSAQKRAAAYPSNNNHHENSNYFVSHSHVHRSPPRQPTDKTELVSSIKSLRYSPPRKTDEDDIGQRIHFAILKSKENIERARNLSSRKSSPRDSQTNAVIEYKPITSFSAEKNDKSAHSHSVASFINTDYIKSEINEYEKFSSEELAKLVADIKKEFKSKETEVQKSQASIITPSKTKDQQISSSTHQMWSTKDQFSSAKELFSSTAVTQIERDSAERNNSVINSIVKDQNRPFRKTTSNPELTGDLNSFDAKINELKKDLQNYFTQDVPTESRQ